MYEGIIISEEEYIKGENCTACNVNRKLKFYMLRQQSDDCHIAVSGQAIQLGGRSSAKRQL